MTDFRIEKVDEQGLIMMVSEKASAMIFRLSPREAWDAMQTIKNGLFDWNKLTRKKIDEGNLI